MAWDFKREESKGFDTKVPEGKHRIRIKDAQRAVSKTGKDMLVLQFEISGYKELLYHYIVFMPDKPEITNRKLTQFFDSFKDIPEGEFNMEKWIGAVGACEIKHEDYNGNQTSKIKYFIPASKQDGMPNWKNVDGTEVTPDGFMSVPEGIAEELPF